jgi:hypothetical protein
MEEKWERVGEETNLQHMHFKKKQNKKEKWAPRAYLFSFPMWLKMTMVAFNLPSKLSQMVAFNLPSKFSQMAAFKFGIYVYRRPQRKMYNTGNINK